MVETSSASAHPAGDAPDEVESQESPGEAAELEEEDSSPDLRPQLEELEDLIRENPLLSVGLATGVGVVLGLLLNRR